jgi:predicted dehydrogenase
VAFGQKKYLPTQGSDAFDAVQATIEWEDGSVLWIQTSWVLSDRGSAMTRQGLNLVGTMGEYWADHMNRNLHFVTEEKGFEHYNPNFFKAYDSWEGEGLVDQVGYGYESIQQALDDVRFILRETEGLPEARAVARRREILAGWKELRALPHQALIGVAVNEAVRLSIEHGSAWVGFDAQMYPRLL